MLELEPFGSREKLEQDLGAIGGVANAVLSPCGALRLSGWGLPVLRGMDG